jgi:hypothetical protein
MFTIFDLLQLTGAAGGICVGAACGKHYFGWPGAVPGCIAGFFLGSFLARIPLALSFRVLKRRIKKASNEELKKDLDGKYFLSLHLIAELGRRGEPVERFWPYVLSLLGSDSSDRRRFGWQNLRIWFPRMAELIKDFNPNSSTERCREDLRKIAQAEPDSGPVPRGNE